ncbi:unnamed protein product [Lampetra fluviatilis]
MGHCKVSEEGGRRRNDPTSRHRIRTTHERVHDAGPLLRAASDVGIGGVLASVKFADTSAGSGVSQSSQGRECSCPGSSNDGGSPRGSSTLSLKVVYSVDVLSLRLPPVQQLHQQQDVHHT